MKFRVILITVLLASVSTTQGIPAAGFELAPLSEYEPVEVRREKKSLTTICVEIKPSSPYEEPYYMCKGTDMPQFSKGGSYGGSGSQSAGYSAKPSYKPKPSDSYGESDSYHSGGKGDYQQPQYDKPSKYTDYSAPPKTSYDKKPAYSDHGSHSAYSNYEPPKSSYGANPSYTAHDSHADYIKPQAHKSTYEKPSSQYESSYSSKPYESSSYGHSGTSEYSKPSSYDHSSSYDSNPSYSDGSHSKPSYGSSGSSYSSPYSKPSSYSANPTTYQHPDHSSYSHSKSSYSESSHAKPYSKPTYDHPSSYSKPAYSPSEYSKPAKPYANSDKGYGQSPSKPAYSSHSSNYRGMSDDMMPTQWDIQSQGVHDEGFAYRSMETPMEYYNFETQRAMDHGNQQSQFDSPTKLDFPANEQDAPILQAAYPSSPYASPAAYSPDNYGTPYLPASSPYAPATPPYSPVAPTYTPASPSYAAAAPSYPVTPSYTLPYSPVQSYAPAYAPPASSYASAAPSYTSAYAPVAPSYATAAPSYKPPCQQSYVHTLQPAIISLPCFSPQASYGQPLGAPAGVNLGAPHQFYPSTINPLQEHSTGRSEGNSESSKKPDESSPSTITQSQEQNKKPDTDSGISQISPKKSDTIDEKQTEKKLSGPEVGAEQQPGQSGSSASSSATESPDAKAALAAMAKMAKIAAEINKDDVPQGGKVGSSGGGKN